MPKSDNTTRCLSMAAFSNKLSPVSQSVKCDAVKRTLWIRLLEGYLQNNEMYKAGLSVDFTSALLCRLTLPGPNRIRRENSRRRYCRTRRWLPIHDAMHSA